MPQFNLCRNAVTNYGTEKLPASAKMLGDARQWLRKARFTKSPRSETYFLQIVAWKLIAS